jgi:transcriptional regulator with PAS, ATPase and Fis domain
MSIHILTTDSKLTQQLTQLLAGGQQPFHFHKELEALITMLPKLKKTDKIFYDLQLEPTLMAFDALRFGSKKTNLIAFERLEEGSEKFNCPKTAKHYFVISPDTRKTGVRLKQVLHEVDALAVKKKKLRKKASTPRSNSAAPSATKEAAKPITLSRYLTAKSEGMQRLLVQIAKLAEQPKFVFITGEDGADFELAARELNFRTNGDQSPLHIADPMRVEIDEIKRRLCMKDLTHYCYLGLSYELGALTVARLNEYLAQLSKDAIEAPAPCFILGHVDDSEAYLEAEVKALIKTFRTLGEVIELPSLGERKDDVSLIAQSIFTTMRTAHPFLMTRTLSRSAIEYLEAQCTEMSYCSLVRIIRNSMALTQREILTEDELKSFGDDSPTSQHLIESLADEKYFKDESGAA